MVAVLFGQFSGITRARTTTPYQVFLETSDEGDMLLFVDVLTGETTEVPVNGARYTAVGGGVLYIERETGAVQVALPDGTVQPHPFIRADEGTHRVDWAVSADGQRIAWTVTRREADGALSTLTRVANPDGTDARDLLVDSQPGGVHAFPVAFNPDNTTLYMDYQPDGLGAFTPYDEYAGLFFVRLDDPNTINYLPDEPGCYCGAGFGANYFLRLAVADDLSGFNLRVFDLNAQVERTIEGSPPENFTQGGDVLVSPDGTRAIYAVAQVRDFGSPGQVVQSVFMLVDLVTETQRQLTQPQTLFIRPIAWTEGSDAIIFTSPNRPGTWKMNAESGLLIEISSVNYIGQVGL